MSLINTEKIDYLKVDIEGSEYDFLYNQVITNIDVISLEIHTDALKEKAADLHHYIRSQGFKTYMAGSGTNYDITYVNKHRVAKPWSALKDK